MSSRLCNYCKWMSLRSSQERMGRKVISVPSPIPSFSNGVDIYVVTKNFDAATVPQQTEEWRKSHWHCWYGKLPKECSC